MPDEMRAKMEYLAPHPSRYDLCDVTVCSRVDSHGPIPSHPFVFSAHSEACMLSMCFGVSCLVCVLTISFYYLGGRRILAAFGFLNCYNLGNVTAS